MKTKRTLSFNLESIVARCYVLHQNQRYIETKAEGSNRKDYVGSDDKSNVIKGESTIMAAPKSPSPPKLSHRLCFCRSKSSPRSERGPGQLF